MRKAPRGAPKFDGCHHWGGYMRNYVKPRIRGFDTVKRKRRVKVSLASWAGLCPGACHWHTTLKEEENPALMREETYPGSGKFRFVWGIAWDDKTQTGRGRELHNYTPKHYEDAVRWVQDTFASVFSADTHVLVKSTGRSWDPVHKSTNPPGGE